jgi:hypothetical protein
MRGNNQQNILQQRGFFPALESTNALRHSPARTCECWRSGLGNLGARGEWAREDLRAPRCVSLGTHLDSLHAQHPARALLELLLETVDSLLLTLIWGLVARGGGTDRTKSGVTSFDRNAGFNNNGVALVIGSFIRHNKTSLKWSCSRRDRS